MKKWMLAWSILFYQFVHLFSCGSLMLTRWKSIKIEHKQTDSQTDRRCPFHLQWTKQSWAIIEVGVLHVQIREESGHHRHVWKRTRWRFSLWWIFSRRATYTGPLTLRMIDRFAEVSMISTRTCVHWPWLPVRPRIFTTRAMIPLVAFLSMMTRWVLFQSNERNDVIWRRLRFNTNSVTGSSCTESQSTSREENKQREIPCVAILTRS